jgi:hypothetical protein
MKLWMAYATMAVSLGLILALVLAGCEAPPTAPVVDLTNSTGNNTVNVATSGGAAGSAPCGATATQQQNGPNQPVSGAPDCSVTQTPPLEPVVVP